jgi:3-dehydroquinate synthetase
MEISVNKLRTTIKVVKEIEYNIDFTDKVFETENLLLKSYINNNKSVLFYDENYNSAVNGELENMLNKYFYGDENIKIFSLNSSIKGKENKDLDVLLFVLDIMAKCKVDTNTLVIGVGGGVLLDIVGLASQLYKRGVKYIRVPTTLIGQIDAGIGLKVGINYRNGKNLIGSFYPPIAVINDFDFISNLKDSKIECGISEILKMAIVNDKNMIDYLRKLKYDKPISGYDFKNNEDLKNELRTLIHSSCMNNLDYMTKDFYEETSSRRIIDFGHVFSSAMEEISNYKISHGYAAAIDMVICIYISKALGVLTSETTDLYISLFKRFVLVKNEYIEFLKENSKIIFSQSIEKMLDKKGNNFNLVIPCEPIGSGGYINLDYCTDLSMKNYIEILSDEKLNYLYETALEYVIENFS